jgi:hypothetical protein
MGRDWKTIKLLKSSDPSHRNPGTTTQEKLKNLLDTYADVFETSWELSNLPKQG